MFSTQFSRIWESLLGVQNAIEEGYWFDTLFERGLIQITTPPKDNFGFRALVGGIRPKHASSGRESLTRFIPLRLKPTGSADDGKREAILAVHYVC